MKVEKSELMEKMREKGISVPQAAEAMKFDPMVLGLYLVDDAFPVPTRILEKLASVVNN